MPTLNWIGKEAVTKHHKEVPYRLLEPVAELSCGDPSSGNLIVQGDNLHALKALLPRYAGQVKCIYIDPPYNTGNEQWAYNDNVNSPEIRRWLGEVVGKEGDTLDRHDRWLCMMYPRLLLLRQFLRADGLIFVSIDDNEISALRLVMDEVFGQKNFISTFVWNTEGHTDNQFHVKVNHEYIVAYARKREVLMLGSVVDPNTRKESNLWKGFAENSITKNGPGNPPSEVVLPVGFPSEIDDLDLAKSKFDPSLIADLKSGKLTSSQLKQKHRVEFPLRLDAMQIRGGSLASSSRVYSGWANVKKLEAFICGGCAPIVEDDGSLLQFFLRGKGVIYYRRTRDNPSNILSVLRNFGTTEQMRSELHAMNVDFKYPKPKELIKYILQIAGTRDAIILDSFAGSGTTGHAALMLNSEDYAANCRFILVEMEAEIAESRTAKRIRQVAQGYVSASGESVTGLGGGFQFCRLSKLPLFGADGSVRKDVRFAQLAEFVWFAETGMGIDGIGKSALIGVHEGRAIYLLYNGVLKDRSVQGGNVLTGPLLAHLPKHDGPKVIYAAACRLGHGRLAQEGIVFKHTPYALDI